MDSQEDADDGLVASSGKELQIETRRVTRSMGGPLNQGAKKEKNEDDLTDTGQKTLKGKENTEIGVSLMSPGKMAMHMMDSDSGGEGDVNIDNSRKRRKTRGRPRKVKRLQCSEGAKDHDTWSQDMNRKTSQTSTAIHVGTSPKTYINSPVDTQITASDVHSSTKTPKAQNIILNVPTTAEKLSKNSKHTLGGTGVVYKQELGEQPLFPLVTQTSTTKHVMGRPSLVSPSPPLWLPGMASATFNVMPPPPPSMPGSKPSDFIYPSRTPQNNSAPQNNAAQPNVFIRPYDPVINFNSKPYYPFPYSGLSYPVEDTELKKSAIRQGQGQLGVQHTQSLLTYQLYKPTGSNATAVSQFGNVPLVSPPSGACNASNQAVQSYTYLGQYPNHPMWPYPPPLSYNNVYNSCLMPPMQQLSPNIYPASSNLMSYANYSQSVNNNGVFAMNNAMGQAMPLVHNQPEHMAAVSAPHVGMSYALPSYPGKENTTSRKSLLTTQTQPNSIYAQTVPSVASLYSAGQAACNIVTSQVYTDSCASNTTSATRQDRKMAGHPYCHTIPPTIDIEGNSQDQIYVLKEETDLLVIETEMETEMMTDVSASLGALSIDDMPSMLESPEMSGEQPSVGPLDLSTSIRPNVNPLATSTPLRVNKCISNDFEKVNQNVERKSPDLIIHAGLEDNSKFEKIIYANETTNNCTTGGASALSAIWPTNSEQSYRTWSKNGTVQDKTKYQCNTPDSGFGGESVRSTPSVDSAGGPLTPVSQQMPVLQQIPLTNTETEDCNHLPGFNVFATPEHQMCDPNVVTGARLPSIGLPQEQFGLTLPSHATTENQTSKQTYRPWSWESQKIDYPIPPFNTYHPFMKEVRKHMQIGKVDVKKHKPRHFDAVEIVCGTFEFSTTGKSNDRLGRIKLLFSRRTLIYEFQLNTYDEALLTKCRQMSSIDIPFRSIVGLNVCGNQIKIEVDSRPVMYLGSQCFENQQCLPPAHYNRKNLCENSQTVATPYHTITLKHPKANLFAEYLIEFDSYFSLLLSQTLIQDPFKKAHEPGTRSLVETYRPMPQADQNYASCTNHGQGHVDLCDTHRETVDKSHESVTMQICEKVDEISSTQTNYSCNDHVTLKAVGDSDPLTPFGSDPSFTQPKTPGDPVYDNLWNKIGTLHDESADKPNVEVEGMTTVKIQCSCQGNYCCLDKTKCQCASQGGLCDYTVCQCSTCLNPLNVLQDYNYDLTLVANDPCMNNAMYKINDLLDYLYHEMIFPCCKEVAVLMSCVPGVVGCPNYTVCGRTYRYSWCTGMLCDEIIQPRNHCEACKVCRDSTYQHCKKCDKCYFAGITRLKCPTCQYEEIQKHQ